MFYSSGYRFLAPAAAAPATTTAASARVLRRSSGGATPTTAACADDGIAAAVVAETAQPTPSRAVDADAPAVDTSTTWAFSAADKHLSPLAARVLEIPGIVEVTVSADFVTVRRRNPEHDGDEDDDATEGDGGEGKRREESAYEPTITTNSTTPHGLSTKTITVDPHVARKALAPPTNWQELKLPVMAAITDFVTSRQPAVSLDAPHPNADTLPAAGDTDVVLMIKEHLATNVRPVLHADGGDLRFVGFEADRGRLSLELLGACRKCASSATTLHNLIERSTRHWIPEVTEVVEVAAARRRGTAPPPSSPAAAPGGAMSFADATALHNRTGFHDGPPA